MKGQFRHADLSAGRLQAGMKIVAEGWIEEYVLPLPFNCRTNQFQSNVRNRHDTGRIGFRSLHMLRTVLSEHLDPGSPNIDDLLLQVDVSDLQPHYFPSTKTAEAGQDKSDLG